LKRPFNKSRYAALSKGLDVSELKLSQVLRENRAWRFDAQYFSKTALAVEATIKRGSWQELIALSDSIDSFGAYALTNEFSYSSDGVPFLRCMNIRRGFIDFSDVLFIPPEANQLLSKSEVKPGMVLLTMSGTVGNTAVALPTWDYPINSNQDIAKITTKASISPYYLAAFFGSKYGRSQLERLPVGSVQQHVFLWMIERLAISRLPADLEKRISEMVATAYDIEARSETNADDAEEILLEAIGLSKWTPTESSQWVRTSRDVFKAGRLDAEHFKPKFAELMSFLSNKPGSRKLGDILSLNQRGKQPIYVEEGLPVVNSKHVIYGRVRVDAENRYALPAENDVLIENGDVLMNGTGVGTIGRAAPFLHDGNALPDNHVTILRPNAGSVDPVYLAVFINSLAGQLQVEQRLRGSSGQIELYPNDINAFTVWIAPPAVQKKVRQAVEAGFSLKKRAHQLLFAAKRAIELAIEATPAEATAYVEHVIGEGSGKRNSRLSA